MEPQEEWTSDDVLMAARVVAYAASMGEAEYRSSELLRPLRKAVGALASREAATANGNRTSQAKAKAAKQERNRYRQQKAAAERSLADRTVLRKGRIERLAEMTQSNVALLGDGDQLLMMIPDGPVVDGSVVDASHDLVEDATAAAHEEDDPVALAACYGCRLRFPAREVHAFYGSAFCPACASLNWEKREQTADLTGKLCLVTGGRVKIGHCVALKLLRAGATVIVTSRFAVDAHERFQSAADFDVWSSRLRLIGCDFRDLRSVEALSKFVIQEFGRLDVLVNNACQTIRRPASHFDHIRQKELPNGSEQLVLAFSSQSSKRLVLCDEDDEEPALAGCLDASGQQLDVREHNSWTMKLSEVPLTEAAEVFAINALAPLSLCARLKPALALAPQSFIVNVSAMEGKFARLKTTNHPHTNMAKAALNMMTRTSAADYAKSNIYMNAVDTGWVNDERPLPTAVRFARDHNFQTPIDEWDAAARILDPVFSVINGEKPTFGLFLKDFAPTEW